MEYKNIRTGVTFSSTCVISGGDWILISDERKLKQPKKEDNDNNEQKENLQDSPENDDIKDEDVQEDAQETKTGDSAIDSITRKQIIQELDAFGIEYNPRAKKQELYDLMMAQGE
ncbi:hypothetical protein ACSSTF_004795 [Escherichia coli]